MFNRDFDFANFLPRSKNMKLTVRPVIFRHDVALNRSNSGIMGKVKGFKRFISNISSLLIGRF